MLRGPDAQSFTRFVVTAGVFLCLAAFIVPALVLRETDVLKISAKQISGLSPVGRAEIERRQRIARDAGHGAPFVDGAFLVFGLGLVLYGAPGLRRQERAEQARSEAELAKLESEIRPQSPEEMRVSLRESLDQELTDSLEPSRVDESEDTTRRRESETETDAVIAGRPGAPQDDARDDLGSRSAEGTRRAGGEAPVERSDDATPQEIKGATERTRPSYAEMMNRVRTLEQQVLARISEIRLRGYELRTNVTVMGPGSVDPLPVDAVLVSRIDQLPDVIVEIKYSSKETLVKNIRNRIADAVYRLNSFRARVHTTAVVWLIVLVDGELEATEVAAAERRVAEFRGQVFLSVVSVTAISDMKFPDGIVSP